MPTSSTPRRPPRPFLPRWDCLFANMLLFLVQIPGTLRFCIALLFPGCAERRVSRRLLAAVEQSAYLRAHPGKSLEELPLVDYRQLEPYIARIKTGESSVLSGEPVRCLLPTSGSTGGVKLIPHTSTFKTELDAAIAPWLFWTFVAHPAVAAGTSFWSLSPQPPVGKGATGEIPAGFLDDGDYLGRLGKRLLGHTLSTPAALGLLHDPEEFRHWLCLTLLCDGDLALISIWSPTYLLVLTDYLVRRRKSLLADLGALHRGSLPPPSPLTGTLRRPRKKRVEYLAGLLDESEQTLLRGGLVRVWPRLAIISCWADAQAEEEYRTLRARFPGIAFQAKGLVATEGIVSIPFGPSGRLVLALASHRYRFLPLEAAPQPTSLLGPSEVEVGQEYELVLSTGNGLLNYRLGDRVAITGRLGRMPTLRFLGRRGLVSDRCGEKLDGRHVQEVFNEVLAPDDFAFLAPEREDGRWRYLFFLQAGSGRHPSLIRLAERVESGLRGNPHYALCRHNGQLGPLGVRLLGGASDARSLVLDTLHRRGLRMGEVKLAVLFLSDGWSEALRTAIVEREG